MAAPYRIQALHIAEIFKLKELRDRFTQRPTEFSNYEMVIRYSDDSYMFVYKYGSVVFFNVPDEVQERELRVLKEYRVLPRSADVVVSSDVFLLEVKPELAAVTNSTPAPSQVFFDRIVTGALSYQMIRIACMLLAESTALEYYETLIENLLDKANAYSKKLQDKGQMLESSEDLIKFIGTCLDTKQEIISNLYIVDSPEETWESVELDKLHQELKIMLEVDTRYRALEYKIKIIQESLEVIVDLSKSKKATKLEVVIIALIAFEIVLSLFKWGS